MEFIVLVIMALLGLATGGYAKSKGYDYQAWFIFGALFFLPAIILAIRPDMSKTVPKPPEAQPLMKCPSCERPMLLSQMNCPSCHHMPTEEERVAGMAAAQPRSRVPQPQRFRYS